LTSAIERVAVEFNCPFFDAGSVTSTSKVDGIHLDAEQHLVLGKALAKKVKTLLSAS
jgi:lysophospholipase L1-like esterase